MSKAPAMPMYWDAYLADTTHLTTEEHGAYMLLLAAMWRRNGAVPDDDKDNARILGLTPAKWRKIKARFMVTISGFVVENDTITQEKLRKTWENTQEKIDKNRKNGAKGGRATSSKTNDLSQANAANSQERKPSIPEPEPEPERKRETKVSLVPKPKAERFEDFWDQYPHRNGAKKGKATAKASYDRQIAAGASEQEIISGAMRYAEDRQVIEGYAKHPATWLNQKGWEDDIEPVSKIRSVGSGRQPPLQFDTFKDL